MCLKIVAIVVDVRIKETVVVMRFEPETEESLEHYHSQVEKIVTAAVAAAKG